MFLRYHCGGTHGDFTGMIGSYIGIIGDYIGTIRDYIGIIVGIHSPTTPLSSSTGSSEKVKIVPLPALGHDPSLVAA